MLLLEEGVYNLIFILGLVLLISFFIFIFILWIKTKNKNLFSFFIQIIALSISFYFILELLKNPSTTPYTMLSEENTLDVYIILLGSIISFIAMLIGIKLSVNKKRSG